MTDNPKKILFQVVLASVLSTITRFFRSWVVQIIFISVISFILILLTSTLIPIITKYPFSVEWLRSFYDNSQNYLPAALINAHPNIMYLIFCSAVYTIIIGIIFIVGFSSWKLIGLIPEIINQLFFGDKIKIYEKDDYFKTKEYKDFTKPKK